MVLFWLGMIAWSAISIYSMSVKKMPAWVVRALFIAHTMIVIGSLMGLIYRGLL